MQISHLEKKSQTTESFSCEREEELRLEIKVAVYCPCTVDHGGAECGGWWGAMIQRLNAQSLSAERRISELVSSNDASVASLKRQKQELQDKLEDTKAKLLPCKDRIAKLVATREKEKKEVGGCCSHGCAANFFCLWIDILGAAWPCAAD